MKAYYFAKPNEKLAYGDNRPVAVNTTHTIEGKPELCVNGLHASVDVFDALQYAGSSILYKVEVLGDVQVGSDKICGMSRTYLARCDVGDVLREFARKQALINIEKIRHYCLPSEYNAILHWLQTGDSAARSAARSAAWSAADSAAYSAADSAVRKVAESAARSAVSSAGSAAGSAARSAWSAARSAAESAERTARSVARSVAESAALSGESAAWSAAYSAALSAANQMLQDMVDIHTGWTHED